MFGITAIAKLNEKTCCAWKINTDMHILITNILEVLLILSCEP